ncbi:MAG: helix-turn-helix domain-containing protein [Verrucomicrobiales bacterium]|nr:helix-turn-helix domain-containing protein [Verrucomicrobiales bacterium]
MNESIDTRRQVSPGRIFRRLADSALFKTYQEAFVGATGLPLSIIPVNKEDQCQDLEEESGNPFCHAMNGAKSACRECAMVDRCFRDETGEGAKTVTCFASMKETAVPVRSGERTLAILRTGQVFLNPPRAGDFDRAREILEERGCDEETIAGFETKWKEAKVVTREHYEGAVTLLAAFALQLADLQNRIFLEEEHHDSNLVRKAKKYVNENLEERICLDEVAKACCVSTFYFCKVFKKSTGMTLTEYVNRRRIEWSKARLMEPDSRIVEVAFDVGYQSLSQFNRCFRKFTGMSPTRFRQQNSGGIKNRALSMAS